MPDVRCRFSSPLSTPASRIRLRRPLAAPPMFEFPDAHRRRFRLPPHQAHAYAAWCLAGLRLLATAPPARIPRSGLHSCLVRLSAWVGLGWLLGLASPSSRGAESARSLFSRAGRRLRRSPVARVVLRRRPCLRPCEPVLASFSSAAPSGSISGASAGLWSLSPRTLPASLALARSVSYRANRTAAPNPACSGLAALAADARR